MLEKQITEKQRENQVFLNTTSAGNNSNIIHGVIP